MISHYFSYLERRSFYQNKWAKLFHFFGRAK